MLKCVFLFMIKQKIHPIFKNFYLNTLILFMVWMLFFDSNNFIHQFKLSSHLSELRNQKSYYSEKIIEVEKDRNELLTNPDMLEKYAREKYFMRKPTEEVYVLVDE